MRKQVMMVMGGAALVAATAGGVAALDTAAQQAPAAESAEPAQLPADRQVGELGRIGSPGRQIMMLGVDAPGFEDLTPRERTLIYHLGRAAMAGNAIFTQQGHRFAQDLITLLDEVDRHQQVLEPDVAAAVREELLRLIIHHGQYDQREHVKHERWGLTPSMLADAVLAAHRDGAKLPQLKGESVDAMLKRLIPALLDPEVEGVHVEQGQGKDIVAQSAVNIFAPGVTSALVEDLLGFWKTKINVRFDLTAGRLMLQEYKLGGLYSAELWRISHWLKKALPLAQSKDQQRSIHALIDYYATGDEALFREHSIHWLKSNTRVDYLNGFIETYLDPRGVVGSFEANVSYAADSALIQRLAAAAPYFETRMPWDKKWQRDKVDPPVASVVNVVMATGDAGPVSAAAYNLPNYDDIRRDFGSKNVVLLNVDLARSEDVRRQLIEEFFPAEDRALALEFGVTARQWLVYMHEVIGHGSGRPDPTLKPGKSLDGRTMAALEECRADLVALYQMLDPKLVEVGAFASREVQEKVARAAYVGYAALDLHMLRSDAGPTLREAHRRGYHLVSEFLLDGGGAARKKDYGVKRVVREGKTFTVVEDARKFRQGVGDLLALLQKFKSTADGQGATDLFARYGTTIDLKLKEEMVTRAAPLGFPRLSAFVYPHVIPVVQDGEVVDARRVHDEDLLSQYRRMAAVALETTPETVH